jgi:hypothetical protein
MSLDIITGYIHLLIKFSRKRSRFCGPGAMQLKQFVALRPSPVVFSGMHCPRCGQLAPDAVTCESKADADANVVEMHLTHVQQVRT